MSGFRLRSRDWEGCGRSRWGWVRVGCVRGYFRHMSPRRLLTSVGRCKGQLAVLVWRSRERLGLGV